MDLGINGKKALVTGASQGIGLAVAKGLAAEGVDLAICARSKERLNSSAALIEIESGRKAVALPGNLAKEGFPANLVVKATQTGQTEDQVEYEYTTDLPRRCMNSPKEIADLIVFLSSERARAISGNFITVDGGLSHSMY